MADDKKDSWGNQAGWQTLKQRGGAYGQGNGWDNLKREVGSIFGSDTGDASADSKDAVGDALKRKMATYQSSGN